MSTVSADPLADASGAPDRTPAAGPGLWALAKTVLKPVASLQLTVALFALSMVLVFFGTVAQKNAGIWTVVDQYFWSYIVWIDLQLAVQFGQIFFNLPTDMKVPGAVPFPAGKLLGGAMFANLIAAHLVRFKLSWKRAGVVLLHSGMIVLFVGEFVTREFQVEQNMRIVEGSSTNYAVDSRGYELAFVDGSDPATDTVTVVPARFLKLAAETGKRVTDPELPVDIAVLKYYANADIGDPAKNPVTNPATVGFGRNAVALERKEATGVSNDEADFPTAYVRLFRKNTDEDLGTYLVSTMYAKAQPVAVGDKSYGLRLRNTHIYKPFRMELLKFDYEQYVGTDKAKNYASHVRIVDPVRGDREVTISMNNPLRYDGEAYFQHQFAVTPEGKTTTLQVVRNPGWLLPYVSCGLVAFGMLLHFGLNLGKFLGVSAAKRAAGPKNRLIPLTAVAFAALYLVSASVPRAHESRMDLAAAARLPVVKDGRVKPLDTVARVDLRLLTNGEEFTDPAGRTQPAIKWFLDTAASAGGDANSFAKYRVLRIENDRLIEFLGLPRREGLRYSLEEVAPKYKELQAAARAAAARPEKDRDLFEAKLLELWRHVGIQHDVWVGDAPLILPPDADGREWRSAQSAETKAEQIVLSRIPGPDGRPFPSMRALRAEVERHPNEKERELLLGKLDEALEHARANDPAGTAWQQVLAAYRAGDAGQFNARLAEFREKYHGSIAEADVRRANFEAYLNAAAPFYHCTGLYVLAFVLAALGWATAGAQGGTPDGFRRAATWVLLLTFVVHTFALFSRMYLMDRPLVFVTNLYSSAVFIGWAAVAIGLVVEKLFPIGLGNAVAAALGFGTSIIAHNLAASGDTLEMMQAVLDTNFWLATHVTTVTLGYSATYIAGACGIAYVLLGVFTTRLGQPGAVGVSGGPVRGNLAKVIGQVMYGIICLATLFSFVGTVLGGIWADQSWGRFWGWDPKENGAVLIVIWNALILHARWCGLVKDRGVAVLAMVGNMVTTWSWFGTNQLGVGLHAYGFSNALAFGCTVTWVIHLGLIGVGLIPTKFWRSNLTARPVAQPV